MIIPSKPGARRQSSYQHKDEEYATSYGLIAVHGPPHDLRPRVHRNGGEAREKGCPVASQVQAFCAAALVSTGMF